MLLRSIFAQYLLESLALLGVAAAFVVPRLKGRAPRRVLAFLTAPNVLRLGGAAAALAAIPHSPARAVLAEVALGDGLTGVLAVAALVLLLRRSDRAPAAVLAMNVAGWLGILVSEVWLTSLEWSGGIPRPAFVHGPTVGAAVFTTLHLLAFHVLRGARPQGQVRLVHA